MDNNELYKHKYQKYKLKYKKLKNLSNLKLNNRLPETKMIQEQKKYDRYVQISEFDDYTVFNTHLDYHKDVNIKQIEQLNEIVKSKKSVILCGDMNSYISKIGDIKNEIKSSDITFVGGAINNSMAIDFIGSNDNIKETQILVDLTNQEKYTTNKKELLIMLY